MGVHGVAAAGARAARVDPLLADRVVEALLLVGLPVAHGGHGPGVHLFATGGAAGDGCGDGDGVDPDRWPLTLRWLCSARLEDAAAAAGADSPWPRTRQVVADSVETALAELLPALGLAAVRETPEGPTRVGPADPAAAAAAPVSTVPPTDPAPHLPAETLAAVRRSAALAGLPLARHPRAAGVALTTCPPVPGAPDAVLTPGVPDVVDVAWHPSPRLPGAPAVSTAVREAMHHAVGSALTACGLRTSWHRPPDSPPHLHADAPGTSAASAPAAAAR
ncbi:hypothetical protein K353_03534 [Kitasatospora sp. SolWspMP-SS2h]|uniref:hypothetical protein n=1 Tax=Kitasatospora sp. SolWspMP-SS2h TaxID=1305729 RepID=UPI000DBF50EA|nr:hypothetical protein [Kitasatospora sp. SolWspMP-SS2h]RAJ40046.1 hypothetical protein K353_03534 [Kitasatospora sp. SolWspMP-SS2h]